ncbi:MAG: phosphatase PAP2 family protein [Rickettsiales bacterium]
MLPVLYGHTFLNRIGLSRLCALVLAGYFLSSLIIQQLLPKAERLLYTPFSMSLWPVLFALLIVLHAIAQERRVPRGSLTTRKYWLDAGYMLLAGFVFFTFCASFGYMKSLIPTIHPYTLDPLLQKIDIALHGGTAPLGWFQSLLTPALTVEMNSLYLVSWITVITLYFFWQLMREPSVGRSQFISVFYLTWIVAGILLATLLASVGPIYYAEFYNDAYSTLNAGYMKQLYGSGTTKSLLAVDARELLLGFQKNGSITDYNGISAMPSLHVGVAFLIALHSYVYERKLIWITIPFALLMFVGSVALGWHYAIDSYVSVLVVIILWKLNRRDLLRVRVRPVGR